MIRPPSERRPPPPPALPGPARQDTEAPLDERERAVHALSRLAFGPRPGDVERVLELGVEAWIEEQLESKPGGPPALTERLEELYTLWLTPGECHDFVQGDYVREEGLEAKRARNERRQQPVAELTQAVALRSLYSDRQLEEVLCEFWRNHFNVSFTKGYPAAAYLPHYERWVVQRHALGTFPDMLYASATHPAMLHYLDNHLSRRPPTKQELAELELRVREETGSRERGEEAAEIAAQRGLNENYARELLELHTLGVDRGYRQKDVLAVAESLTGWTIDSGKRGNRQFVFRNDMHLADDRHFLGFSLREDKQRGPGQGERILEILSNHDLTAEFVATKLVRYLVDDRPPRALVQRTAKAYQKSRGDIPTMVRAIVEHDLFWSRAHYRSKFKTPYEFVVSALRMTGAEIENLKGLGRQLSAMGQPIYHCDDPTGYYDTAEAWLDPGVLALRWKFALDLAENRIDGVTIPRSFWRQLPDPADSLAWMQALVTAVLPGGAGSRTLAMLWELIQEDQSSAHTPDSQELGPRLLGLLLGSPEFQQQ